MDSKVLLKGAYSEADQPAVPSIEKRTPDHWSDRVSMTAVLFLSLGLWAATLGGCGLVGLGRAGVARSISRRIERRVVLLCFDVDDFGIARTAVAQFIAYWSGIAFLVEELLPLVIGRPPAVATVIPAGDPRIGSGSKCNAIGHCALPSPQKGCCSVPCKIPTLAPRHRTVWAKKGHMCGIPDGMPRRELWRACGRRYAAPAPPVGRCRRAGGEPMGAELGSRASALSNRAARRRRRIFFREKQHPDCCARCDRSSRQREGRGEGKR